MIAYLSLEGDKAHHHWKIVLEFKHDACHGGDSKDIIQSLSAFIDSISMYRMVFSFIPSCRHAVCAQLYTSGHGGIAQLEIVKF